MNLKTSVDCVENRVTIEKTISWRISTSRPMGESGAIIPLTTETQRHREKHENKLFLKGFLCASVVSGFWFS
jgi:hypothetical protein